MALKIAIDMDGTISDFVNPALENIKKLYGLDLKYNDIVNPSLAKQIFKLLPKETVDTIGGEKLFYREICPPRFFMNCEPYPGAVEAVKELAKDNEVFFLTMTPRWRDTPHEKAEWLKKYFAGLDYHTIMVDDAKGKHLVNVDIVIDDDPRVLNGLSTQIPICIKHPWNKDFINQYWYSVDDMVEAAKIVKSIAAHKANFDSLFY